MVKVGDTVVIKKGTTIHSTSLGYSVLKSRKTVYVGQILEPGMIYYDRKRKEFIVTELSIRWAGQNGYWNTVPVTAIETIKAQEESHV